MPIETKTRKITSFPPYAMYKPPRVPIKDLTSITMAFEEYEAIRLIDFMKKDQREAAELMTISQPTFNRILKSARYKIASVLVNGQVLILEGGTISIQCRIFKCKSCSYQWTVKKLNRPYICEKCQSTDIQRINKGNQE